MYRSRKYWIDNRTVCALWIFTDDRRARTVRIWDFDALTAIGESN